jgi:glycosyltransferase involved in cell wall biosynthesis
MSDSKTPYISIVVPVFSEEPNIQILISRIAGIVDKVKADYEIIFIDDGSYDATWRTIHKCAEVNKRVKGASFSRNFGKEAAILAGLDIAKGDVVITIDGDLQHPPELIPLMYSLWANDGVEIVDTIKKYRQSETIINKIFANSFYKIFSSLTGFKLTNITDYKLLDRRVVDNILDMPESNRFFRGMTEWVGFKHATLEINIDKRERGDSKWNFAKLIVYAFDNIVNFSTKPLYFVGVLGVTFSLVAIILLLISIYRYIVHTTLSGFPTVIILILFVGGIVICSNCLIGVYIAKLTNEVKKRPKYIKKDEIK